MKKKIQPLNPFISVAIIIFSMLTVVFLKMEARRMGYTLLKESRHYKTLVEQQRLEQMNLARLVRPERIETLAQKKLDLQHAQKGQIVQLTGTRIVLRN